MLKRIEETRPRYVRIDGLCVYLSMGKNKAIDFANSAGAKRKFGKIALYDLDVIDSAIEKLHG